MFNISRFPLFELLYEYKLHFNRLRNRPITVFDIIEPGAHRTEVQQCQDYLMRRDYPPGKSQLAN